MTPGARLAAAIEALDAIEAALATKARPADAVVQQYFRDRRYIGGGDRRAIGALVYQALRRRGVALWAVGQAGLSWSGRGWMIAEAARHGVDPSWFGAGGYGAATLDDAEQAALATMAALGSAPLAARANMADDLFSLFSERFGDDLEVEVAALGERAPLDLRVNAARANRADMLAALADYGIDAAAARFSPWGIRIAEAVNLQNFAGFRDGLIEIQDEAAQLAVLLSGARPGMTVIDLCAGAGGKTLALGTLMGGEGRLVACDIDPRRLAELRQRAERAKLSGVETVELTAANRKAKLGRLAGADLVLVDAPCSGSGTLRRGPDLGWRHDAKAVKQYAARQAGLLDDAVAMLRPGGRLVYATCSLFGVEDEDQARALLARHPGVKLVDYRELWPGQDCPQSLATLVGSLLLTPHQHCLDGFFIAIFERL